MLLINPHLVLLPRRAQDVSEEGLNAYGAADVGAVLSTRDQRPRRLDEHGERCRNSTSTWKR